MDSNKQGACFSSSSSSFTADLFGTTESAPVSSAGIFASMFPPPSTVVGRKSSGSEVTGSWQKQSYGNQAWYPKQGSPANSQAASYSMPDKDRNSVIQEERVEPCHLSSSLYYGGQENYSQSPSTQMAGSYPIFKKDGGEDDPNGSNPHSASRGNWWQGIMLQKGLEVY
ncbi:uncharacterized protein LOC7478740 isoform X1 [Populus trichocarpa]|uniref:Uncharacterized protein n=1 Tax=Populus tomentosa TaxID=118781 RepID=A0A385JI89_POPTO|nr:uncharacterized protein LOC7478740 isoform X1 [Populus trichocarpa]AXY97762.1 hypothetical protein Potri.009G038300 [Populus tomentosa]